MIEFRLSKWGERKILFPLAFSLPPAADLSLRRRYSFRKVERMDYKESDPFYHRKEWKRIRKQALQRDGGMCRDCMDRMKSETGFRPNRATMVHHIIPRSERPDLELVLENLISLCDSCHEARHPEKRSKIKRKTLERAGKHQMRVIKV